MNIKFITDINHTLHILFIYGGCAGCSSESHSEAKEEEEGAHESPQDCQQLSGGKSFGKNLLGRKGDKEQERGVEHGGLGSGELERGCGGKRRA